MKTFGVMHGNQNQWDIAYDEREDSSCYMYLLYSVCSLVSHGPH